MDVGSYYFATSGDLVAVRWHDRQDIYMLSTAYNTSVEVAMKRPKAVVTNSAFLVQVVFPTTICTWPTEQTREAKTPLQVFQLLLTCIVMESIVQLTRLFAEQKGVDFPFCVEELAFIATTIAMKFLWLPQIRDYWSRSEILPQHHAWFPSVGG